MFVLSFLNADEWTSLYPFALLNAPVPQTRLLQIFQLRDDRTKEGRYFDAVRLKEMSVQLAKHGLLKMESGKGYMIQEHVRMQVLEHLHTSGALESWIGTIRAQLTKDREYFYQQGAEFCNREMLFAAFLGKHDELTRWRNAFFQLTGPMPRHIAREFFASEAGTRLFAVFNSRVQQVLLSDALFGANWYLYDVRAVYEYASRNVALLEDAQPGFIDPLLKQALLRGDVERAQALSAYLPAEYAAEFAMIFATLRGDFLLASACSETLLKHIKTLTGKRKIFLPQWQGLLHAVVHLALGDAGSLKAAKAQIEDGEKQRHAYAYHTLKILVSHLLDGTPLNAEYLGLLRPRQEQDIDALFEGLVLYWVDVPKNPRNLERLQLMRDAMKSAGYLWVAAELDALLYAYFALPKKMGDWHTQHGYKPLYLALQKQEAWQRALTALAQVKSTTMDASDAGSDTRLIWQVIYMPHYVKLEPREQKKSAKGTWSKGRPVALKRLFLDAQESVNMNDQDKRIAQHIRKTTAYYGGAEYELDDEAALPHLIGHPQVYWSDAPDVRIDVVKGEVALQLKEKGDHISLALDPAFPDNSKLVARKETPTRLALFSANPEIKQIASIVGNGLTVPVAAKAQLVEVIAAIAPHLAIHSDVPELGAHMATVDPDMTIYVHLLPLQEGLRLQFLMRPLKDGGWFPVGQGSSNVLGEQDGKAVQASRSMKAETKNLERLLAACPAITHAENEGNEWQLTHPEHCLELLSELKAQPEDALQLVWPEGERFRIKGSRSLQQMRMGIKKQGEWFVASGEITLDDGRVLALRELMQLSESASSRFLKLGDNDYLALTDSFRKRLEELRAFGEFGGKDGGKDGVRINPLAAASLAEMADEVGELKADSAWREQIKKLDSLASFVPVLPSTLQAELRDYQLDGFQWLARLAQWGVGACLADDMGLGKTVQTLALLLDRAPKGPALVVAPISVAMNWQSESARFAPTLNVRAYHNNRSMADLGAFDLVIVSYGMLQADAEIFATQHWHTVVLDEAQVIKNAATKRSQAAMALTADFKMIASGTPVENHLGELWNLFRFINPGLLGSKERFVERFSTPIERGDKPARQHLKKLIQPFILRRTKTQVLSELPSRTEITLQVTLSDEERHLYEALRQEAIAKINEIKPGETKAMQVLAEITKLRRFCCHPKLVMKNASVAGSKLAVFAETVQELLENKHKALVFSQFVDHLSIVRAWLDEKGISYQYLDGSTPPIERKKRVDAFQAGQGDIFLISLKAGGSGLNLTAADYVIHLDPWWNPAVEDQASDRAHRMGQTRPVTIYRLVTQETIEEKILALHAEKRDLADSLLDGGDASGKMDTAALLKLLKESV
jgi:superfamily II DNA or RNA helicase